MRKIPFNARELSNFQLEANNLLTMTCKSSLFLLILCQDSSIYTGQNRPRCAFFQIPNCPNFNASITKINVERHNTSR